MDRIKATLEDPNRKSQNLPGSGLSQLIDFVASKEEEIASKDKQIANNHAEIQLKDREIASLKANNLSPLKQLEKYIASKDEKIASLEATVNNFLLINHTVDLTSEEAETKSKRPRTGNTIKSYLPKLIEVKEENDDLQTALKTVEDEKKAVEANLEDAQEDFEIARDTVDQQLLTTDILQGRIDELVALFQSGQADGAAIAEIRGRSLASGS